MFYQLNLVIFDGVGSVNVVILFVFFYFNPLHIQRYNIFILVVILLQVARRCTSIVDASLPVDFRATIYLNFPTTSNSMIYPDDYKFSL